MGASIFKAFVLGTFLGGLYFFFQHWQQDLTYLSRTNAGLPIWRNHVNYACTLVLNIPILGYLYRSSKHPDRWMYRGLMIVFVIFLYFSYTRIAYLALLATLIYRLILYYKLTKITIALSIMSVAFASIFFLSDNRYVHLAPEFDRAIMQSDFQKKLTATTQGQDISSMERLHRWVAGGRMFVEKALDRFRARKFLPVLQTLFGIQFETYVSDNPDRSGIHNYFLMLLVEQGIPGLLLFILILIVAFMHIEGKYHVLESLKSDP